VKITGGWGVITAPRQGFPGSGIADETHGHYLATLGIRPG
jgi:hypothetical protein